MLKYVIIMNFIAKIFAQYCLEHYLCDILVFFVRKRLRIKMGQMVTERGNHLFLYTFQLKIFALAVQVTRFARDFYSLRSSTRGCTSAKLKQAYLCSRCSSYSMLCIS